MRFITFLQFEAGSVTMMERARAGADGRWRRRVFAVWVSLTIVASLYLAVVGPFAAYFREDLWLVGVVVPPLMILLLSLGLAWLVWIVTGPRRPGP